MGVSSIIIVVELVYTRSSFMKLQEFLEDDYEDFKSLEM